MLYYLFFGLLCGFLLPFIAGRFGKIVPADPGMLILLLPHRPRFPKVYDPARQFQLRHLWHKMFCFATGWAVVMAGLFLLTYYFLPIQTHIWTCILIWMLCCCIVIDAQYWLLPDFFTIPLLLLGLTFNYLTPHHPMSFGLTGAIAGYLMSVISVLVLAKSKHKDLGAGDVKMITALGAWLGIMGLNICLILSFFLFIGFSFIPFQKKGAYGPALCCAAIVVFFWIFQK